MDRMRWLPIDLCHPRCAAIATSTDLSISWCCASMIYEVFLCGDYHILFLRQRIIPTDMAEPWQLATFDSKISWRPARISTCCHSSKHSPVAFVAWIGMWAKISIGTILIPYAHPSSPNWMGVKFGGYGLTLTITTKLRQIEQNFAHRLSVGAWHYCRRTFDCYQVRIASASKSLSEHVVFRPVPLFVDLLVLISDSLSHKNPPD